MLTSRLVLAAPLLFGGGRLAPPPGVVMRAGDSDATLAPRSLPFLLQPEPGLAIGGALLFALLVNRALFTPELYNAQSRADLIATVAPVLIVLKALGDLDITPREAEAVAAVGYAGEWLEPALSEDARQVFREHGRLLTVAARDVRFGRGGTVSFESLRSEFGQNSVRNHENSARILSEFARNPEI